jgi:hypothetical protein
MRAVHLVMRTILGTAIGALALVLAVTAAASTPQPSRHTLRVVIDGRSIARRFPHGPSISFRYPANWHVRRHRLDNVLDPHTLFAVATTGCHADRSTTAMERAPEAGRPTGPSSW